MPDQTFEAAVASLTAARDQAEQRADEAQQRADRAEARADEDRQRADAAVARADRAEQRAEELREQLDKLLHDQKAADAVALEALMKSEALRVAEAERKGRGRLRRAWDGWRGR